MFCSICMACFLLVNFLFHISKAFVKFEIEFHILLITAAESVKNRFDIGIGSELFSSDTDSQYLFSRGCSPTFLSSTRTK